jgi:multidrug efflux pump subunit AcrA (membrane-fusion protein)
MIVTTSIDEIDISKVSLGMPVSIMFDQIDGTIFMEGTISDLSYEASSSGGKGSAAYFPATITISNPGNLKPGMGVSYTINAVTKEDVLMVPSSAIINTEFGPAVFVRAETSNLYPTLLEVPEESLPKGFVAIPVSIGLSDAMNTEIVEGLEENVEVYLQQTSGPDYGGGVIMK